MQLSEKLLKVKVSQLMVSHFGHIHAMVEPFSACNCRSCELSSVHELWYHILQSLHSIPPVVHVTWYSQIPQG